MIYTFKFFTHTNWPGNRRTFDIQYFFNLIAGPTQLVGMTPNIKINWKAKDSDDKYTVPIGIGTIGMLKLGKLPVRVS